MTMNPLSDATIQMSDAGRTQMGGFATCPVCHSNTPLGEIYCSDCGFMLSAQAPAEELAPSQGEAGAALVAEDGRRFVLRPGTNTVGRQATDILIEEVTVSRVHAKVVLDGNRVMVEDLGSSNGTKVGDLRLSPNVPTPAPAGTRLRFGNWRATLEMNGLEEPEPIAAEPVEDAAPVEAAEPAVGVSGMLSALEGPGGDIWIGAEPVTIGRRPDNMEVIQGDAYVSGYHAALSADGAGCYIVDVGSTNGTTVNGLRLYPNDRKRLVNGDEVRIGQTRYMFKSVAPTNEPEFAGTIPFDSIEEFTPSAASREDE
jgi:pSer/pThr/pTyr-binding forkhead associated (FHA) protein